jgi:glycosyltransferase involved in cell wall biosynthesis
VRIALVHDYLNQYGGAERVLEVLHDMYPDAPIYTSLYDPATMPPQFRTWDIRTSFLQRMPFSRRAHRAYLLLYPLAFESFDLSGYDLVLSNSSAWCKGVITPPDTLHVCYCLAPMRFAWTTEQYVQRERMRGSARRALPPAMHYLRLWDVATANRVDRFIGISQAVVDRIRKYYRRDAELIYPPVNARQMPFSDRDGQGFLVVSRLIPYKRIDLAVSACTQLGLPIQVIGDGRDRARLESVAGPSVRFLGRQPDDVVQRALTACRAFLFPGEEDFGIAPVEAMAAGRPVVAYGGGGALDTVVPEQTGLHFNPQTPEALGRQLQRLSEVRWDHDAIRAHALQFDVDAFRSKFGELVSRAVSEHRAVARTEKPSV